MTSMLKKLAGVVKFGKICIPFILIVSMCCTWTERTWSNCHIADTSVTIFASECTT